MAGMGPATPHAFYTKPYAQNDFVMLRVISQRMALTAGKLKLLPTDSIVLHRSNQDDTPFLMA